MGVTLTLDQLQRIKLELLKALFSHASRAKKKASSKSCLKEIDFIQE